MRPWENTLTALNASIYSPNLLKRYRFSASNADVAMNLLGMEAQAYRRLAIQSLTSICTNLASADILLWRGDLMDAALADARLFDGTEMTEEILPPRPEFYLLDPQSPPSREWERMSEEAADQFGAEGGLSLRGILVASFTEEVAQKIMPESLQRSGAQTALLSHLQAKQAKEGKEAARPALMVTLVFRAQNESNDSKTMPYLIDATQFTDVPIHGTFAMMAIACRDFVEQPFVGRGDNPFPKWRRPDLPGLPASKRLPQSVVKVIVLRRLARRAADAANTEGGVQETEGKRDYDIQWIVSGHRRRLNKPRKFDGKQVIYIAPYLKGNPEAPLTPRLNLAHVRR